MHLARICIHTYVTKENINCIVTCACAVCTAIKIIQNLTFIKFCLIKSSTYHT